MEKQNKRLRTLYRMINRMVSEIAVTPKTDEKRFLLLKKKLRKYVQEAQIIRNDQISDAKNR